MYKKYIKPYLKLLENGTQLLIKQKDQLEEDVEHWKTMCAKMNRRNLDLQQEIEYLRGVVEDLNDGIIDSIYKKEESKNEKSTK